MSYASALTSPQKGRTNEEPAHSDVRCFTASTLAAQQSPTADQPKITVTGESLVYAKPDKIVINFGIESGDNQLVPAKEKNAAIWKKAAAVLKESGIPNKDVQTDYLSIEPRYRNYNEIDDPIGYVVRQHVRRDALRSRKGGRFDRNCCQSG